MTVLIVAATEREIAPFKTKYPSASILITGVGISNTIYYLLKHLQTKRYDLIIQIGIAGRYNEEVEIGEVVVINEDCFADFGVFENSNFNSIFEMGLMEKNQTPFIDGVLQNKNANKFKEGLKIVKGATVNTLTDNVSSIKSIVNKYSPVVETMEGAAFHYVCNLEGLFYLQIRGISNDVGIRDKSKWEIAEAIESSNDFLIQFLKNKNVIDFV
jgi:futalosine hydrolase